jgi:hypothetical protein
MVTLGLAVAVIFLLVSIVKVVRICTSVLQELIQELRLEQQLLGMQKQIVANINSQIGLQRVIIEKQLEMAMNSITAMKLLQDKEQDPRWMDKFHDGRNNAKFN